MDRSKVILSVPFSANTGLSRLRDKVIVKREEMGRKGEMGRKREMGRRWKKWGDKKYCFITRFKKLVRLLG
jgi:hypothetical protein